MNGRREKDHLRLVSARGGRPSDGADLAPARDGAQMREPLLPEPDRHPDDPRDGAAPLRRRANFSAHTPPAGRPRPRLDAPEATSSRAIKAHQDQAYQVDPRHQQETHRRAPAAAPHLDSRQPASGSAMPEPTLPAGRSGSGVRGGAPRINARHARSARRHSIFVAIMKGLLPSLAICLVLVGIFYAQGGFAPELPDGFAFDPGTVEINGGGIAMIDPKLTGLDQENQHFEVSADSAIQDPGNAAQVNLKKVRGRMALKDGGWVQVDADGGIFDTENSVLNLNNKIEVTMSNGSVARLNGATVDMKKGEVETGNPVVVYMDAGVVSGNAMTIFDKGKRVLFRNGAAMTINGDPSGGTTQP